MIDAVHWALSLGLALLSLAIAGSNYDNLFDFSARNRARHIPPGSRVSPIMFLGGIAGAAALRLWPAPDLAAFWWVPFLLDWPGTLGVGRAGNEPIDGLALQQAKSPAFAPQVDVHTARLRALERAVVGCVLGTAVGDALGLASEGLSPRRRARLFPDASRYHLLPTGRGMCSDDTEHTVMLAQSICEAPECTEHDAQARAIAAAFAWRLRFWLLGLPAGIGLATLRAILKLWLFVPTRWSGVNSAGNAPAMRSALLGLLYPDRPERMRCVVRAMTRITHTDPKAEHTAWTVAYAAQCAADRCGQIDVDAFVTRCREALGSEAAEWIALLEQLAESVRRGDPTPDFARALGLHKGVTGYCFHSVPVALHAWLSHPADYRGAVLAAIECGGDTDTVAAIAGAIAGAGTGKDGIPAEWLDRLVEWPRTVAWMERLGKHLAQCTIDRRLCDESLPTVNALALLLRNAAFIPLVLAHGFRRLLPPW